MSDSDGDEANIDDLFASYYGIEAVEQQESQAGASKSGRGGRGGGAGEHDEDDEDSGDEDAKSSLESPLFDSGRYVQTMLNTQQAHELLDTDVALVHDIRGLDSDMQMLVYENYNKFIAATETIRRMKTNVEAMDDDMNIVKTKMQVIRSGSATLDHSLEAKNGTVCVCMYTR